MGAAQRGQGTLIVLMCGVSFAVISLIGLAVPLIPAVLEGLDVPAAEAVNAALMSSFPTAMLLASPVANWASGRFGRHALLRSGLCLTCAATVLLGLAPRLSCGEPVSACLLLLAARALQGFGAAASNLAVFAIIVEAFQANLGTVMGLNEIAIGVASTTSPVAGALLYRTAGFEAALFAAAALVALMLPLAAFTERAQAQAQVREALLARDASAAPVALAPRRPSCGELAAPRLLLAAMGLTVAMGLFGVCNGILVVHLHRLGLDDAHAGVTYGLFSLAYAVAAPVAGLASDHWRGCRPLADGQLSKERYQDVMALGLALSGVSSVALGLGPLVGSADDGRMRRWGYELAALSAMGMGQAAALIPSLAAVKAGAPAGVEESGGRTDAIVTLYNVFMQVGLASGPLLGAACSATLGFETAMMVVGAVCIVYAASVACVRCLEEPPSRMDAAAPGRFELRRGSTVYGADLVPPPSRVSRWRKLRNTAALMPRRRRQEGPVPALAAVPAAE